MLQRNDGKKSVTEACFVLFRMFDESNLNVCLEVSLPCNLLSILYTCASVNMRVNRVGDFTLVKSVSTCVISRARVYNIYHCCQCCKHVNAC